jgi:hypothetical protein
MCEKTVARNMKSKKDEKLIQLYIEVFKERYDQKKNYLAAVAHMRSIVDIAFKECWKRFP